MTATMGYRISKRLMGAVSLLIFLVGCSKDGPGEQLGDGEYFFHFKVDGQAVSYPFTPETHINLTAVLDHDPASGLHAANIAGIKDNTVADLSNRLTFFLGDPGGFTTAVAYSNVGGAGRTVPEVFHMGYVDAQGDLYLAAINTTVPALYENAVLQFTELAEDRVSGTFSGTLKRYGSRGGVLELLGTLTVSEGSFRVPRY